MVNILNENAYNELVHLPMMMILNLRWI